MWIYLYIDIHIKIQCANMCAHTLRDIIKLLNLQNPHNGWITMLFVMGSQTEIMVKLSVIMLHLIFACKIFNPKFTWPRILVSASTQNEHSHGLLHPNVHHLLSGIVYLGVSL